MGGLGVNTHTLRKRAVHPQRTSKAAANFSLLFFEKIDRVALHLAVGTPYLLGLGIFF